MPARKAVCMAWLMSTSLGRLPALVACRFSSEPFTLIRPGASLPSGSA